MLECVKAYNNWVSEYASAAPKRFFPMTALPFWDTVETVKEMERRAKMGHRGIIMCGEPEVFKRMEQSWEEWETTMLPIDPLSSSSGNGPAQNPDRPGNTPPAPGAAGPGQGKQLKGKGKQ